MTSRERIVYILLHSVSNLPIPTSLLQSISSLDQINLEVHSYVFHEHTFHTQQSMSPYIFFPEECGVALPGFPNDSLSGISAILNYPLVIRVPTDTKCLIIIEFLLSTSNPSSIPQSVGWYFFPCPSSKSLSTAALSFATTFLYAPSCVGLLTNPNIKLPVIPGHLSYGFRHSPVCDNGSLLPLKVPVSAFDRLNCFEPGEFPVLPNIKEGNNLLHAEYQHDGEVYYNILFYSNMSLLQPSTCQISSFSFQTKLDESLLLQQISKHFSLNFDISSPPMIVERFLEFKVFSGVLNTQIVKVVFNFADSNILKDTNCFLSFYASSRIKVSIKFNIELTITKSVKGIKKGKKVNNDVEELSSLFTVLLGEAEFNGDDIVQNQINSLSFEGVFDRISTNISFADDQSKFDDNQSDVADDQSKFDDNQSDVADDQSKFDDNQSDVADDQTKFDDNQVDVADDQTKFDDNQVDVKSSDTVSTKQESSLEAKDSPLNESFIQSVSDQPSDHELELNPSMRTATRGRLAFMMSTVKNAQETDHLIDDYQANLVVVPVASTAPRELLSNFPCNSEFLFSIIAAEFRSKKLLNSVKNIYLNVNFLSFEPLCTPCLTILDQNPSMTSSEKPNPMILIPSFLINSNKVCYGIDVAFRVNHSNNEIFHRTERQLANHSVFIDVFDADTISSIGYCKVSMDSLQFNFSTPRSLLKISAEFPIISNKQEGHCLGYLHLSIARKLSFKSTHGNSNSVLTFPRQIYDLGSPSTLNPISAPVSLVADRPRKFKVNASYGEPALLEFSVTNLFNCSKLLTVSSSCSFISFPNSTRVRALRSYEKRKNLSVEEEVLYVDGNVGLLYLESNDCVVVSLEVLIDDEKYVYFRSKQNATITPNPSESWKAPLFRDHTSRTHKPKTICTTVSIFDGSQMVNELDVEIDIQPLIVEGVIRSEIQQNSVDYDFSFNQNFDGISPTDIIASGVPSVDLCFSNGGHFSGKVASNVSFLGCFLYTASFGKFLSYLLEPFCPEVHEISLCASFSKQTITINGFKEAVSECKLISSSPKIVFPIENCFRCLPSLVASEFGVQVSCKSSTAVLLRLVDRDLRVLKVLKVLLFK
ncbi:hypothetical protein P9112_009009 [Eukaryota sp. TZLM1-RC]